MMFRTAFGAGLATAQGRGVRREPRHPPAGSARLLLLRITLLILVCGMCSATSAGQIPTIDLAAGSDSGFSDTDNVTNRKTLLFTGLAPPNSTVAIKSGKALVTRITSDRSGSWSVRLIARTDGLYKLSVVANGQASRALYLLVDTVPPRINSMGLSNKSDTGASNSDGITNDKRPTLVGNANENVARLSLFYDRFFTWHHSRIEPNRNWKTTVRAFDFKPSNISAQVEDLAGNRSERFDLNIVFDMRAPEKPSISIQTALDLKTGGVSPGTRIRLSGRAPDRTASSPSRAVDLSLMEGAEALATPSVTEGHWRADLGPMPLGIHTIHAATRDIAGNTAASEPLRIKVLKTPRLLPLQNLLGRSGFRAIGPKGASIGWVVSRAGDINGDGFDDLAVNAMNYHPSSVYVLFGKRDGFARNIRLDNLTASAGFRIEGTKTSLWGDSFGASVSALGDVNGDGVDDVGFGAPNVEHSDGQMPGASYILFGRKTGFPSVVYAADLLGEVGVTFFGLTAKGIGDVNGDGTADVAIRPSKPFGRDVAKVHIVYGPIGPHAAIVDPAGLSNKIRSTIVGPEHSEDFGTAISGDADINGDGIHDLIVSAPDDNFNDVYDSGVVAVIFGRRPRLSESVPISSLRGTDGFRVGGNFELASVGSKISTGDVNGDGFDDIAMSRCSDDHPTGLVMFGKRSEFKPVEDTSNLKEGSGFSVSAETASGGGSCWHRFLSIVGDTNGDNIDDMTFSIPDTTVVGGKRSGVVYEFFGKKSHYRNSENVNLVGSAGVVRFDGAQMGDRFGSALSDAGDFNGDGLGDVIVGAPYFSVSDGDRNGAAYVIFGKR